MKIPNPIGRLPEDKCTHCHGSGNANAYIVMEGGRRVQYSSGWQDCTFCAGTGDAGTEKFVLSREEQRALGKILDAAALHLAQEENPELRAALEMLPSEARWYMQEEIPAVPGESASE